jgi:hypothetical protein
MKKLDFDTIIYSLNIEDVQTVAFEEFGRELSKTEIESIKDLIASNVQWYDAIANAIRMKIKIEEYT